MVVLGFAQCSECDINSFIKGASLFNKLNSLQITSITLLFDKVTDCGIVGLNLQAYIPRLFVSQAIAEGIPLQSASLGTFACTFPGTLCVPCNVDVSPH